MLDVFIWKSGLVMVSVWVPIWLGVGRCRLVWDGRIRVCSQKWLGIGLCGLVCVGMAQYGQGYRA